MNEDYFKVDAKQLVDMLFDTKMFREDVTRDDLNAVEEFIGFTLQSKFDLHMRVSKLAERIDKPPGES